MTTKQYLGDGCYVRVDVHGDLVLTTENGVATTNVIVLEPHVWIALAAYVQHLRLPEFASEPEPEGER